jgi:hypothetical protein
MHKTSTELGLWPIATEAASLVFSFRFIYPQVLRPQPGLGLSPSLQSHSPLCISTKRADGYHVQKKGSFDSQATVEQ